MNLKKLMEQRKQSVDEMADLIGKANKEKRSMTTEENEAFDKAGTEEQRLTSEIEKLQRLDEAQKRFSEPSQNQPGREDGEGRSADDSGKKEITPETRALAFQGWANFQMRGETTSEQRDALRLVGMNAGKKELSLRMLPRQMRTVQDFDGLMSRAMSTTLTEGGDTIPEDFIRELETNMLYFGGIMGNISVLRTNSGADLPQATFDDTGNLAVPIAEAGSAADGTAPTTDSITWGAHKYTTKVVKINQELLEDSAFNMAAVLSSAFGERIGRVINQDVTNGDASDRISGILKEASKGVTMSSTTIDFDDLLELIHSVDVAYRNGASFSAHDSTILAMRKVKDKDDNYIWQQSVMNGQPSMIMGYPVITNNDVPALADQAKSLIFGNLSRYRLRMVREIRTYRMGERYRENDQDGFVAFVRMDGHIIDAGTDPLKYAQVDES